MARRTRTAARAAQVQVPRSSGRTCCRLATCRLPPSRPVHSPPTTGAPATRRSLLTLTLTLTRNRSPNPNPNPNRNPDPNPDPDPNQAGFAEGHAKAVAAMSSRLDWLSQEWR